MIQTPAYTLPPKPGLGELARQSARIGILGFGGPTGQIALMHKIFVEEKKWVDEDRYLYALSYCTLLPGPEAQQLATYIGWLLHGVRGGLIAGTLFVLPGAFIMLALSWFYMTSSQMPLVTDALYGVRCVVLALIIQSVVKIAHKSLKVTWTKCVAGASFLALLVLNAPFPLVILAAGLGGFCFQYFDKRIATLSLANFDAAPLGTTAYAAAIWMGLWLAPVFAFALLPGTNPILSEIGQLFSALSLVTFGGAYAATAWLNQQAVEVQAWLSATQMMDGLALVQAIPGPLVLVNQYVGFVAGWNEGGLSLAIAGALLASWCTFAPSFVWIFAGAPFAEKLRDNRFVATALKGVNAAVVGVVASLAFSFGIALLFDDDGVTSFVPSLEDFDVGAACLVLAAMALLTRTKLALPLVLVLGLAAGMVVRAF